MDKAEFLRSKGWGTWYADDYWVHPKTVLDPKSQDYTNYGMPLEVAYQFETEGWEQFRPMGLPALSIMAHPKGSKQ